VKKFYFVSILLIAAVKLYSQCVDCHNGINYSQLNNKNLAAHPRPADSSGGLAKSYYFQNICGLNWQQSSILVETRSQQYNFNANGTGLPAPIPMTFDTCKNIDSVVKALLYFNGSYFTPYAANPASVSITNPSAQVFSYSADSIGTGPSKCWGETGTIAYRVDVTNCIKGGGSYLVNLSGTGITAQAIDGITFVIVYVDKSVKYSGSLILWDGLWTGGGVKSQTFTGFNVCEASSSAQAFGIFADMQINVNAGINDETFNGSTGEFSNLFYNFCTVTTSVTTGQTSTTYSAYTNNGGDCYSWVLSGLYWQNTNCVTCHPSAVASKTMSISPKRDTICQGDSVQLTATGCNSYIWIPATGLSCSNCPNPKASPNANTTYSVTGYSSNCTFAQDTVQIVVGPKTNPVITPQNPGICLGNKVQLNVTGGINYAWKPATALTCTNCANPVASPTTTTTYTLFSGSNGCRDSITVTVSVTPTPTVTITPPNIKLCRGNSIQLNATGASNFTWSPSNSLSCNNCSSPVASPTVTTTYTIIGSTFGCNDTITDKILVGPPLAPVITPAVDTVCQGSPTQLVGSGGGTYRWSTKQASDSIIVAPQATTTYTLTVSNGVCSDSTTATIYIKPKVFGSVSIQDSIICPSMTSQLTIQTNGQPATYKWSNGATSSSIIVHDTVTTTYTATLYGICDSVQYSKTVVVVPLPKPVITGTPWKCRGVKDTLFVTGGASYKWSNGRTTTAYFTGGIAKDSTIYVTVKNSLGCAVVDSFTVDLRVAPTVGNITPSLIACAGIPVTLKASSVSGQGPFTYTWEPGGATTDSINILNPDSSTSYTVTVSNGCKTNRVVTVTPNNPNMIACCNQTLLIEHDTTILFAGPDTLKYQWLNANEVTCLNPPLCDSVKVTPKVTTTYTVIGTDRLGCESVQLITVVIDVPCFNLTIPNVITPNYPGPYGKDNVLYIKTENIDAWTMTIFDRWGKEIYTSNNQYQYWNGNTESGDKALDGVYYYVIDATCQSKTYKQEGFIQLIR